MTAVEFTNLREQYEREGYVIARNVLEPELAAEMVQHVEWLLAKHPGTRPEQLHHELMQADPFMHRLAGDDRLLDIAEQFIGPNIALFAAHYISKSPGDGQAVLWHQDGSYWPLEPMEVVTLWVAGSDSTVENGCMRVLPGTQNNRLLKRSEMQDVDDGKNVLGSGIDRRTIDESQAVDLELKAGDVSIHNPAIIHGSNANTSDKWRHGLTLRYIPTSTRVMREHQCLLLRGDAVEGINTYEPRPRWTEGEHMPFRGCEDWK